MNSTSPAEARAAMTGDTRLTHRQLAIGPRRNEVIPAGPAKDGGIEVGNDVAAVVL